MTDGRTDRQTSCHGIVRAIHTRRAVKSDGYIGADFAGATGAIAPQSKFCEGDAPAVTREVAPVNHGPKPP